MLLPTDRCERPDVLLSSPTVPEQKCTIVNKRSMPGEWQHCPVHSHRLSFALRLQYSRHAAIQACGAAGRITASFQTTSLASLILPLPNSDLSVFEYTIVRNLILLSVNAEEKNAKGQHAEGHMEGLFPCKTGRCVIRLRHEAALCFSYKSNNKLS